ncbi:ABC transporter substrate-binding protein, partial [Pseudonocardia sp.]
MRTSVRPRRRLALLALVTSATILAACSTTGGPTTTGSAPTTLTLTTGFAIDDLDPLENAFWGPEFGYVELLMRPERGGAPSPWVLRTLTNPSPLTWVLTLNDNVAFQNGRRLDGAALAELITYQLARNEEFGAALPGATAAATGPSEVTLTTSRPAPNVPFLLADEAMLPVYDAAAYQRFKDSGAATADLLEAGLYTGAYRVDSLDSTA